MVNKIHEADALFSMR